jgi:Tol biopolymer transport system component
LWIVNETGFPRELFHDNAVRAFSWSPAGDRLLLQGDDETWFEFIPGGSTVQLGFTGKWAAALGSGLGYVYIDDANTLHRWSGADEVISTDVAQAAVAPNGLRVAFVHGASATNQVWAYDVGLRARYQLAVDTGPVSSISWAPSGNRIAYLRSDSALSSLQVRNLTGAAATTTVAVGDLGVPSWLPDSTHIVFAASVQVAGALTHKAFVVNVVAPPAALNPALGLPADPSIDVASPVPSPDGHQIAFLNLNQTENQVWLMNADGTRPAALTRFAAESFPYSCRALAWTKA